MANTPVLFRGYGENAATFLIFQALAQHPSAIADVLIKRLKQFGGGKPTSLQDWGELTNPEVWLFPSFGKRYGFGEPDALVLVGRYAIWFEVETTLDCQRGLPRLRTALIQLLRFRAFAAALRTCAQAESGSLRIKGRTLTDAGVIRPASLKLAGHGVMQKIRSRLTEAEHHFVLMSISKPKGEGHGGSSYAQVLKDQLDSINNLYEAGLPALEADRCWYVYWEGDLSAHCIRDGAPLDLNAFYVRNKKR